MILDLLLVGGRGGGTWLPGGPWNINEDPLVVTLPDLPPGHYRIHALDRFNQFCVASEFSFWVESTMVLPTPTPTLSPTGLPETPTPTRTPSPTRRYDLITDGIINAKDLLEFLKELESHETDPLELLEFSRFWLHQP